MRVVIFFFIFLLHLTIANAQWTTNLSENTPVVTGSVSFANQFASDNAGGFYLPFVYKRTGRGSYDVYIQHVNSMGVKLWSGLGIKLSSFQQTLSNYSPHIVSDEKGGAIVMWQYCDSTFQDTSKVLAQRINSQGQLLWKPSGVLLSSRIGVQNVLSDLPMLYSDKKGGAFAIINTIFKGSTYVDLIVQRINSNGSLLFSSLGIIPYSQFSNKSSFAGNYDNSGGIVLSWASQNPGDSGYIFVQKVDSSGNLWSSNGIKASSSSEGSPYDHPFTDLNDGVYVVYVNNYQGAFIQRVNSAGQKVFSPHGIMLNAPGTDGEFPHGKIDNSGNAFVSYITRSMSSYRIYTQKISPTGELLFGTSGKRISSTELNQESPLNIISDGLNGFIIPYSQNNGLSTTYWDIYGQRINNNGDLMWGQNGTLICNAQWYQTSPFVFMMPNQKFVFSWNDQRYGQTTGEVNIYVQRVNLEGTVPVNESNLEIPKKYSLSQNYPNPFNPSTVFSYSLPKESEVVIFIYDATGRSMYDNKMGTQKPGIYSFKFDAISLPSGIYFYSIQANEFTETKKMLLLK